MAFVKYKKQKTPKNNRELILYVIKKKKIDAHNQLLFSGVNHVQVKNILNTKIIKPKFIIALQLIKFNKLYFSLNKPIIP